MKTVTKPIDELSIAEVYTAAFALRTPRYRFSVSDETSHDPDDPRRWVTVCECGEEREDSPEIVAFSWSSASYYPEDGIEDKLRAYREALRNALEALGRPTDTVELPAKLDVQELAARSEATRKVARWCLWPWQLRTHACNRVEEGYKEHLDDLDSLLPVWEAACELADVGGYAGIALRQGRWNWRWWVAVVLVGLAFRVIGRMKP